MAKSGDIKRVRPLRTSLTADLREEEATTMLSSRLLIEEAKLLVAASSKQLVKVTTNTGMAT